MTARALKPAVPLKNVALMGRKKVKGRKRHIVIDTQGHLLHVKVHAANIHDTVAGCQVFKETLAKNTSNVSFGLEMNIYNMLKSLLDKIVINLPKRRLHEERYHRNVLLY